MRHLMFSKLQELCNCQLEEMEFLLSLSFVVDNMEEFQTNANIHSIIIRHRYNHHVPNTNLSKCKN
jgi:hypothetical protein